MSISPYQTCPCGSGKAFKWCCQAIYPPVEKAISLLNSNQPAVAVQTIKQLTEKNPKSPQAWAYEANVLLATGDREGADAALQKAFDLDPNFPLAHWIRGGMRHDEGEEVGALLLFRKTAELLDPQATDLLAQAEARIAEIELSLNRPLAGRAAMERARNLMPKVQELREAFDNIFGPDSRLQPAARRGYVFRTSPNSDSWKDALEAAMSGKLTQARKAWEAVCQATPTEPAAWFNLGLVQAWLGDNAGGIESLHKAIDLDDDETRNGEAGLIAEVLRTGLSTTDEMDHLEHRVRIVAGDGDKFVDFVNGLIRSGRLLVIQQNQEERWFVAALVEDVPDLGVGIGSPVARLLATVHVGEQGMLVWHSDPDVLQATVVELQQAAGAAFGEIERGAGPAPYGSLPSWFTSLAVRDDVDEAVVDAQTRKRATEYFEEKWARQSLRSLGGATPLDAANHPMLRKRLPGLIAFLEDFNPPRLEEGEAIPAPVYDFARLRRKLGLNVPDAPAAEVAIDALGVAELAALDLDALDDARLAMAFRTAVRLDADEIAGKVAAKAIGREGITDRYVYFKHLADANPEGDHLTHGEDADRRTNAGGRAVDYALARGRAAAKGGKVDEAVGIFDAGITASPTDLRLHAAAAEAMLGKKRRAEASRFAEAGLKQARQMNNRDGERQFQELMDAATKLAK